jgi:hypothetical protein
MGNKIPLLCWHEILGRRRYDTVGLVHYAYTEDLPSNFVGANIQVPTTEREHRHFPPAMSRSA